MRKNKAFSFETKRLCYEKNLFIWIGIFLLFFLACVVFFDFVGQNWQVPKYDKMDRIEAREDLERRLIYCREQLENSQGGSIEEQKSIEERIRILEYCLETGTHDTDYFQGEFTRKDIGTRFSMNFIKFGLIPIFIFAIGSGIYLYGNEYRGKFRLAISQGAARKQIFINKTGALAVVNGSAFFIVFFSGLISSLFSMKTRILVSNVFNETAYSISAITQFFSMYAGLFVLSFFLLALTVFLCTLTRKSWLAAVIIIMALLVDYVVYILVGFSSKTQLIYFPFFGLIETSLLGFTMPYFVSVACYLLLTALMLVISYKVFEKQEL